MPTGRWIVAVSFLIVGVLISAPLTRQHQAVMTPVAHATVKHVYLDRTVDELRASRSKYRVALAARARRKIIRHLAELRRERRSVAGQYIALALTGSSIWDALAKCESGGNWQDSAGEFEGGVQFLNSTWLDNGGGRYASHAYLATRGEQIQIAEIVQQKSGWGQWPVCSRALGLS